MIKRQIWKQSFYILFLIAFAFVLLNVYYTHTIRKNYFHHYEEALYQNVLILDKLIIDFIEQKELLNSKLDQIKSSEIRITVILPSGEVIADSKKDPLTMDNHINRPEIQMALKGQKGIYNRYSHTVNKNSMYVAIPLIKNKQLVGVLRASTPVVFIENEISQLQKAMLVGGLIIVIIALLANYRAIQKVIVPIKKMQVGAESFANGNLNTTIPEFDIQELDDLRNSLNEMAKQIHEKLLTINIKNKEQEAVFTSMTEGVVAIDNRGLIIKVNPAFQKLFAQQIHLLNHSIFEVIRNKDCETFIQQVLEEKNTSSHSITWLPNIDKYLSIHSNVLKNQEDEVSGAVLIFVDITKMKKLEQIRQDFITNASHEIRTPITSIKGFVETILLNSLEDPDEIKHFLEIILKQSNRLNAIIDDLLLLSRLEEDQEQMPYELGPVRSLIESAALMVENEIKNKNMNLVISCDENLKFPLNPNLMEQALLNLIVNAVKYSPNGSTVTVSAVLQNESLQLAVKDNGPGIPLAHHERLFERFYRVDKARSRKLGGTGLGLSIVKHIAQVHNGSVSIQSEVGTGSTFFITIPTNKTYT